MFLSSDLRDNPYKQIIPETVADAKSFIDKITNEWCQESSANKTVGNFANQLIKEELSGNIYLKELLQNADDACSTLNEMGWIRFEVVNDYLLRAWQKI